MYNRPVLYSEYSQFCEFQQNVKTAAFHVGNRCFMRYFSYLGLFARYSDARQTDASLPLTRLNASVRSLHFAAARTLPRTLSARPRLPQARIQVRAGQTDAFPVPAYTHFLSRVMCADFRRIYAEFASLRARAVQRLALHGRGGEAAP